MRLMASGMTWQPVAIYFCLAFVCCAGEGGGHDGRGRGVPEPEGEHGDEGKARIGHLGVCNLRRRAMSDRNREGGDPPTLLVAGGMSGGGGALRSVIVPLASGRSIAARASSPSRPRPH